MTGRGYNSNYQIVQSADSVAILMEMMHETRVIPLDGRPHLPAGLRKDLGDSRGHWDLSALPETVVEGGAVTRTGQRGISA